jgi:hypothetical protein
MMEDIPQIGLQTVNNIWIGRSLRYFEMFTPFIGLLSAGAAINKYFFLSLKPLIKTRKYGIKSKKDVCMKVTQTFTMFLLF